MIIKRGDIFMSEMQTITNAVNCLGVMGKGIALSFKSRFPKMYRDYVVRCRHGKVLPGIPYLYSQESPWILNFPTVYKWGEKSDINNIIMGLQHLLKYYKQWNIKSLAIPALGCGCAKLSWTVVKPIMIQYLSQLEIDDVELYEPL